jgi:hypothetical protein
MALSNWGTKKGENTIFNFDTLHHFKIHPEEAI